jgi:spore maturation protein SpmA
MLDVIWPILIALALVCGALTGRLDAVGSAVTDSASQAVQYSIGLLGMMVLGLGLVRVLDAGGAVAALTRALQPLMRRLFPDIPPDHPALGLMALNISSNVLGLTNASTPIGLKAMIELERLNPHPGVATNAMALLLAINTSNVQLFPTEILALRAAVGANVPGSIIVPILLATAIATTVAIVAAKLLEGRFPARPLVEPVDGGRSPETPAVEPETPKPRLAPVTPLRRVLVLGLTGGMLACLAWALRERALSGVGWGDALKAASSSWALPFLVALVVLWGLGRGVAVYAEAVEGGREAVRVVVQILPYLVAIFVAVGMLRASGGFDLLMQWIAPVASALHIPPEAVPMGLLRSLSGSGSRGLAADIMQQHGPDSFVGNVVSVILGSTDTTFYVLAVYFGAVRIRATRHTLPACLIADVAGVLASVWVCRLLLS